jgi:putative ABC transport system permease protein
MPLMTGSQARENLLAALETLRANKTRSALTVMGIVIGVSSVISMASIIGGLNKFVQDKVESLGSRTYFLSRFPPGSDPTRWPERIRTRRYFEYTYADYIREAAPDVEIVTTVGTRAAFFGSGSNLLIYGGRSVDNAIVRGAEPQYIDAIPLFSIQRGRFITHFDLEHARPVVVLGAAIAESLFPNTDALGKTIRINGGPYEVVGVFEHDQGLFGGPGVDVFAVIPLSNFRKEYPDDKELVMAFTVPQGVNVEKAQDEVIQAMRHLRRVPAGKENDFELSSPDFLSNLWNQLTGALVILTTVISSIGLLVGGIGVMNIMLISVTERTQEIGVRKAIGARRADVRLQFLLEAVMLTLLGGSIGILIGAGVSVLVRTFIPSVPATLSYLWVAIGFLISVGVGLGFGYYPANLAAGLDPIVCLRYE